MKVLIAERSKIISERIVAMVSYAAGNNQVRCVNTLDETMERLHIEKPEALILALQLLGTHGVEIVKYIRQYVPIIIVLIDNQCLQYQERISYAGANFIFDKSGDFERIPDALNNPGVARVA